MYIYIYLSNIYILYIYFLNEIDLNISNSKELIDNCSDYKSIGENYLEWKVDDWKAVKQGNLYNSPIFKFGDNVW